MKANRLFVAAKACIVNDANEVLVIRESSQYEDSTNVRGYDVPGGRMNMDETLEEALRREVREEVGLSITACELIDAYDTFNQKGDEVWHVVRLYYKVRCEPGEVVLSKDHDEYKWVPIETIEYAGVIDNLIPILKKL